MPLQDEIDKLIREEITEMREGDDPVEVKRRIQAALGVLKFLQAPRGKPTNARRSHSSGCSILLPRLHGPRRVPRSAASLS